VVVSSVVVYGDALALPNGTQIPRLWKLTSNDAEATPEPVSAEFDETVTAFPRTLALAAGAVTEPVGAVLSTRTFVIRADVNVLPTLSVVTTRRS
jgi:hypothetical protein